MTRESKTHSAGKIPVDWGVATIENFHDHNDVFFTEVDISLTCLESDEVNFELNDRKIMLSDSNGSEVGFLSNTPRDFILMGWIPLPNNFVKIAWVSDGYIAN